MAVIIELLKDQTISSLSFDCGIEALNRYLATQAKQDMKRHLSATYLLRVDTKIIGYYTLSSTSVSLHELKSDFVRKMPRYPLFPATLIGRLAIDNQYKGRGFGEKILLDALKSSYMLSKKIGSIAVILDAKNKEAVNFYLHYGFIKLDKNKMFLPMKTIKKLFD